ncbi:hypothetical protein MPSEU_000820700 [Mayamaea pseudoterrestris]|nr:hypothetical protein MPSEU_000820700 [Mayamaea pseudoterrestris]
MTFTKHFINQRQCLPSFHQGHGRIRVKRLVLSAAWILSSSTRRSMAIIAEGKGRTIISNSGDATKTAKGVADALEQFTDCLRKLQDPQARAARLTKTSPSLQRATLRSLALAIFENYPTLPWYRPDKQGWEKTRILRFLAEDCTPSHDKVADAAQTFTRRLEHLQQESKASEQVDGHSLHPKKPSMHALQQACTPEYERVITQLLQIQADQGLAFLLHLRRDLLHWMAFQREQPLHDRQALRNCQQLDEYLACLFQTWFAPGLLKVERITYDTTSAAIIERIARNEAVHPVQDLADLRRRLGGTDRRVFCIFHPLLDKCQPLLVLYVALTDRVPNSMNVIHDHPSKQVDNVLRVATFYSISNFETGLKGVGLGEYLIHQAVDLLRTELPQLKIFCTLSPLPKFRSWLQERTAANASGTFASSHLLNETMRQKLADALNVTPDQSIVAMLDYLSDNVTAAEDIELNNSRDVGPQMVVIRDALMQLAAHYLINEKHREQPLDPVARFHIGNGALVHAIRWGADNSSRGWSNSFGIMVNYEYDLECLTEHQVQHEQSLVVPMRDNVRSLLVDSSL